MAGIFPARFNMTALVLAQGVESDGNSATGSPNGYYENVQDPDTGVISRVWVIPSDSNPTILGVQPSLGGRSKRIKCTAMGIVSNSARGAGTSEMFSASGIITTLDLLVFKYPREVVITRRDRITDIRNRKGKLMWKETEYDNSATEYEVTGVTPVHDTFGIWIENSAILHRADVQTGGPSE